MMEVIDNNQLKLYSYIYACLISIIHEKCENQIADIKRTVAGSYVLRIRIN